MEGSKDRRIEGWKDRCLQYVNMNSYDWRVSAKHHQRSNNVWKLVLIVMYRKIIVCINIYTHFYPFSKSKFNPYEAQSLTASTLLHRLVLSIELGTVQTGTRKVDPAWKFKCTTTGCDLMGEEKEKKANPARETRLLICSCIEYGYYNLWNLSCQPFNFSIG